MSFLIPTDLVNAGISATNPEALIDEIEWILLSYLSLETLSVATYTETLRFVWGDAIVSHIHPTAIASVSEHTIVTSKIKGDWVISIDSLCGEYEVSYTAGYDTLPETLKRACIQAARALTLPWVSNGLKSYSQWQLKVEYSVSGDNRESGVYEIFAKIIPWRYKKPSVFLQ